MYHSLTDARKFYWKELEVNLIFMSRGYYSNKIYYYDSII